MTETIDYEKKLIDYMIKFGNPRENIPIFQKWSFEEIKDYQEIGEVKLEPSYIHVLKNIFSRNYSSQFKTWSREDIQKYQEKMKKLEPIYNSKGILRNNPESRVKCMTNILKKIGYNFKLNPVNALAINEGKAKALVCLEGILLDKKRLFTHIEVELEKAGRQPNLKMQELWQ